MSESDLVPVVPVETLIEILKESEHRADEKLAAKEAAEQQVLELNRRQQEEARRICVAGQANDLATLQQRMAHACHLGSTDGDSGEFYAHRLVILALELLGDKCGEQAFVRQFLWDWAQVPNDENCE